MVVVFSEWRTTKTGSFSSRASSVHGPSLSRSLFSRKRDLATTLGEVNGGQKEEVEEAPAAGSPDGREVFRIGPSTDRIDGPGDSKRQVVVEADDVDQEGGEVSAARRANPPGLRCSPRGSQRLS